MTTATVGQAPIMDERWWEQAKCAGDDPDKYELKGERDKQALARELCAGCHVVQECAQDAINTGSWGLVRAGVFISTEWAYDLQRRDQMLDVLERIALGVE